MIPERVSKPAPLRVTPVTTLLEQLAPILATLDNPLQIHGHTDDQGVADANQHFHRALVAMGGSPRLQQQMNLLLAEMRLFFHQMGRPEEFHRPYLEENAIIARLLATGRFRIAWRSAALAVGVFGLGALWASDPVFAGELAVQRATAMSGFGGGTSSGDSGSSSCSSGSSCSSR